MVSSRRQRRELLAGNCRELLRALGGKPPRALLSSEARLGVFDRQQSGISRTWRFSKTKCFFASPVNGWMTGSLPGDDVLAAPNTASAATLFCVGNRLLHPHQFAQASSITPAAW